MMTINTWANRCGYFYNAHFDSDAPAYPNNGYNCRHPEQEEVYEGIGCCYAWSCPLIEYTAESEECDRFGHECDPVDRKNCEENSGWEECDLVVVEIPDEMFNENCMWREVNGPA